jgi:hypothetical protein
MNENENINEEKSLESAEKEVESTENDTAHDVGVGNIIAEATSSPEENYKIIAQLLKTMDDSFDNIKDSYESTVKYINHLDTKVLSGIIRYSKDDIKDMPYEDMVKFIEPYKLNGFDVADEDGLRKLLLDVKGYSVSLFAAKKEAENNHKEADEILEEFFKYLNSSKIVERRKKQLAELEKAVEVEPDSYKKKEMEKAIEAMKESFDFSFILERLNKYGKEESDRIMEGFFGDEKSKYILKRFDSKIEKFGYKKEIISHFFNLEDNFLPEEYAAYNNLFLFISISFIAYADRYNKTDQLFVKALIGGMANLIYHKFSDSSSEQTFVNIIKSVDDKFSYAKDRFVEENTTYKNHPSRIERDKERNDAAKQLLRDNLDKLGVENINEDASIEELAEMQNECIDKYIERDAKIEERDKKEKEATESDDSVDSLEDEDNEVENTSDGLEEAQDSTEVTDSTNESDESEENEKPKNYEEDLNERAEKVINNISKRTEAALTDAVKNMPVK